MKTQSKTITTAFQALSRLENDGLAVRPVSREPITLDGKRMKRGPEFFRIQGVTYGPFAANAAGEPFPDSIRVRDDFALMRSGNINSIRTYNLPPDWFLDLADEEGMTILMDIPWAKHLCFLDDARNQEDARQQVRAAARKGANHPSLLAYSIGNEIPPDIVRWHGATRVERFLAELADVARQTHPEGLITYANYPPTEYLSLPFLDFATFNVYLHDLETFRRYLFRLQNLVGDTPLVLGELGMDTFRQGESRQAEFLKTHLEVAQAMGLAGTYVFSWTDEWHTGGHQIQNWAFGVTKADRHPKKSFSTVSRTYQSSPVDSLPRQPKVSIVVCSYNGGSTLAQCLQSLLLLEYPDFEIVVVDDGSTDNTRAILEGFPSIRKIHQPNRGLSVARNVGMQAASGSIIAYTDSDCFADLNWLTHLVYQLEKSEAVAVGGPNLTPEDGWLAACVAASPGQPMHVLESDQVAEHIPGCNMAFRKDALLAINGFDPQYRKAGDDVDICWRLQEAGHWITFAPGAFVWHHRRQNPRAYFRQQAGYGEAEALLRFKHPNRFNNRGDGKWRGVLYGPSLQGLRLDGDIIYRGVFGTGLFQCIYQPGPAHWAMLPSTLEWHFAMVLVALGGIFLPSAFLFASGMLGLSILVAFLQARQAQLTRRYEAFLSRVVVSGLCYAQPLVRSWHRYRTRFLAYRRPTAKPSFPDTKAKSLNLRGRKKLTFWTEEGVERTDLIHRVIDYLDENGWGRTIDNGWESWDVEMYCHPWTVTQICTVQENHGGNRRLFRIDFRLRFSDSTKSLTYLFLVLAGLAGCWLGWKAFLGGVVMIAAGLGGVWWRGTRRADEAVTVVRGFAQKLNLIAVPSRKAGELT